MNPLQLQPIEGDFVELQESAIFEVKGLIHPAGYSIAFPRYLPDAAGERVRGELHYRKVAENEERYRLASRCGYRFFVHDRAFDLDVWKIPHPAVSTYYDPREAIKAIFTREQVDSLESEVSAFTRILMEASGVESDNFGVTGSVLLGLHQSSSDIDLTVYGSENCSRVKVALNQLLTDAKQVKRLDLERTKQRYKERIFTDKVPFDRFALMELRKTFQGSFQGTEFFIRYLKDRSENHERYEDTKFEKIGVGTIKAKVADDSEGFFTPCIYKIRDVKFIDGPVIGDVSAICSFRGRFCEQARNGETVVAKGKVEKVFVKEGSYSRLVVGNDRRDFMFVE